MLDAISRCCQDTNYTRSSLKRIDDPRSSRSTHRYGQFVRPKIAKLRDFVSRMPRMLSRDAGSQRENNIILQRLRVNAQKLARFNIKTYLFSDFASQRIERGFAAFNATARSRPSLRRVIQAHTENAPVLIEDCCEYA